MNIENLLIEFKKIENIKTIESLLEQYSSEKIKQLYEYTIINLKKNELLFQKIITDDSVTKEQLLTLWHVKTHLYKFNILLLKALNVIDKNDLIEKTEMILNKVNDFMEEK